MTFYLHVRGEQYGPVDRTQISEWITGGNVSSEDLIFCPVRQNWIPLGSFSFDAQPAEPIPQPRKLTVQDAIGALVRPIEPVAPTISYRCGLCLTTGAMVILPMIYAGIVGIAAWGVYTYAIFGTAIIGRNWLTLIAYCGPLIAGSILIAFMVRPLFSLFPASTGRCSLRRADEPVFFAFVDRICDTVGSPKPVRIEVTCDVNASAGFDWGFSSFLKGHLVLTVGLPLVSGIRARNLAGVLAHEFGHFSQGSGLRLVATIRYIEAWFARVVYHRDHWDEKLEHWAKNSDIRVGLIFYLAIFFVWVTREILHGLMYLGGAISSYMSRQMEFDADRYEARVVGTATFEQTCRSLITLNLASRKAMAGLSQAWIDRKLSNNYPIFVAAQHRMLPAPLVQETVATIMNRKAGIFDSHPDDAARIASVRREGTHGVFELDTDAVELFADFGALARRATLHFYRNDCGLEVKSDHLMTSDDLLEADAEQERIQEAYNFFQMRLFTIYDPITVENLRSPTDGGDVRPVPAEELVPLETEYNNWIRRADELIGAERFVACKIKINPSSFNLKKADHGYVKAELDDARRRARNASEKLKHYRMRATAHIASALRSSDISRRIRVDELLDVLKILESKRSLFDTFQRAFTIWILFFTNTKALSADKTFVAEFEKYSQECASLLAKIRNDLESAAYPFDHSRKGIRLGEFLIENLPKSDDPPSIYRASSDFFAAIGNFYFRCLGALGAECHR